MLTREQLQSLLSYNPITGAFTWRVDRRGRTCAGAMAGTKGKRGYIVICIDRRLYAAHRLAWLYMTGEWPHPFVDHKDTNKTNNAWENLRIANKTQNCCNTPRRKHNRSGFKGVHFSKSNNGYVAEICFQKRRQYLGTFATAEAAHAAYCMASERLHGEFARTA